MVRSISLSRPMSGSMRPVLRLLVEVDAIGFERVGAALLASSPSTVVESSSTPRTPRGSDMPARFEMPWQMKFTASKRVMSCSVQEKGRVALALGEDRDKHIGARNLLAPGGLHMHDGAMDDALEARAWAAASPSWSRTRLVSSLSMKSVELGAQPVEIDVAGPHDRRRIPVVEERQKQVFQRGVFVMALVGVFDGAMEQTLPSCSRMMALPHLLLFHGTLQRMLMLPGEVHHLRHFRLGNLISVDAAYADALLMDMEHDPRRLFAMLVEEAFEDIDHELHRSVIVIQKKNFVKARPLRLWTRFRNDPGLEAVISLGTVLLPAIATIIENVKP